jgi:putative addiction module component
MPFSHLLDVTLMLPLGERTDLAYYLLQTVEEDPEYEREVMEEVMRRYREFKEGKTEPLSGEEVLASLREELEASRPPGFEIPTVAQRKARVGKVMALEDIRHEALKLCDFDRVELAYAILRDVEEEGFMVDWEALATEGL